MHTGIYSPVNQFVHSADCTAVLAASSTTHKFMSNAAISTARSSTDPRGGLGSPVLKVAQSSHPVEASKPGRPSSNVIPAAFDRYNLNEHAHPLRLHSAGYPASRENGNINQDARVHPNSTNNHKPYFIKHRTDFCILLHQRCPNYIFIAG